VIMDKLCPMSKNYCPNILSNGNDHPDSTKVVTPDGDVMFYMNGELNGLYGPAILAKQDGMEWYEGGYQAWFLNNKLNRLNGPAVIRANGECSWYKNGVRFVPLH
jgi:hypothetical protein